MADAYEVLGLLPGSTDDEIRRRYLDLVRRYRPDQQPQRFAAVREAYEQLRDPLVRLEACLFPTQTNDTIDAILADVESRLRTARIPAKVLLSLVEQ